MNEKQTHLVTDLLELLAKEERDLCRQLIDDMAALGYLPEKQKAQNYTLSFKHRPDNRVIAKIRCGKDHRASVAIKFFGCTNVPEKLRDALGREIISRNGQYTGPLRDLIYKNKCGFCKQCTGGGVGYYYRFPDGREVLRCGAYPIEIPDLAYDDIGMMKEVLAEQHRYFQSIV